MPPSFQRVAALHLMRSAGFASVPAGGRFGSEAWTTGAWAGKWARDRGEQPDPPNDRPQEFYEGYTWGFDNAPHIEEAK